MRRAQIEAEAARLGVPTSQVARDVLLSHALARFPSLGLAQSVVFFGGTALCRTHLPGFRLSEDIDLLADDPSEVRDRLEALPGVLEEELGDCTLSGWDSSGATSIASLSAGPDRNVQLQVVPSDNSYKRYPTEPTPVELRYPGLPDHVVLRVPTATAATGMKLAAWSDRATARDLADLYALAEAGHLDREAIAVARQGGVTIVRQDFDERRRPTGQQWQTALGSQMAQPPDLRLAWRTVRAAVARTCGWEEAEVDA